MDSSKGFTLIELLVVIAIIAVLMGILMPVLGKVREQARSSACQASLHQWTLIWNMYTSDNDGHFHSGQGGESNTSANRWPFVMQQLYKDRAMRTCPMASKPVSEGGQNPFAAWGIFDDGTFGSYGLNEWLTNRPSNTPGGEIENYFKNIYSVKQQNTVPAFLDCAWYDVWTHSDDEPPQSDGDLAGAAGNNEIKRVCLNRHNGSINCAFLDWSIRQVDLKELWTLKWHKNYDTSGPWTQAGGVQPDKWPQWMRKFRDY